MTSNRYTMSHLCIAVSHLCMVECRYRYVFVYLGMAIVSFPIFHGTVWLLVAVSAAACLVGRLHIYLGAARAFKRPAKTTATAALSSACTVLR